ERLPYVDEGEIQYPEGRPHSRRDPTVSVGIAGDRDSRERHAQPGCDPERGVRGIQKKQSGRSRERHVGDEARDREEPVLAEQRDELIGGARERDEIDARERSLEEEPRAPVALQARCLMSRTSLPRSLYTSSSAIWRAISIPKPPPRNPISARCTAVAITSSGLTDSTARFRSARSNPDPGSRK